MHTASPHGALWPQNVLLTARGLLVVDGFVAVSVAPERLAARIEHHPRSSPFAAPELLGGRRPTASADLYALGAIVADLAPKNIALLAERDRLQNELDAWHKTHPGPVQNMAAYQAYLEKIGYLLTLVGGRLLIPVRKPLIEITHRSSSVP
jgi:serine/threonine protein kinase